MHMIRQSSGVTTPKPLRDIPFFNYPALFDSHEREIIDALHDVLSRGAYILQHDLRDFEERLQRYLDVNHVIGVADGTNAILLALRAAGIGPGDEVILPAHTYIATASAVHDSGATPVPVECGADHLIDPQAVEDAITPRTRAILPVQLNGRTADMDALQAIADRHDLLIIEDAAQALGSRYKGRHAGTFGTAGTYSFYPAKLLGCFGDGGAVVTDDDAIAERVRQLRDHGRNADGEVVTWGTNCRLDNVQAAVLNLKLRTFTEDLERRRAIARRYHESLHGLEQITLPPGPDDDPKHFDVYQNYEIEAEDRGRLREFLQEMGIRTLVQFGGKALHQHRGLGFDHVHLPFTERLYTRCLMLPMNTTLSDRDVDYIVRCVRRFYV